MTWRVLLKRYAFMSQKADLRSYHRRSTTRVSGFHTNNETTGGECIVLQTECFHVPNGGLALTFSKGNFTAHELFNAGYAIAGFGGYLKSTRNLTLKLTGECVLNASGNVFNFSRELPLAANTWTPVGFHEEIPAKEQVKIATMRVTMTFNTRRPCEVSSSCFDMGGLNYSAFYNDRFEKFFNQQTMMYIPDIYYLNPGLSIRTHLQNDLTISPGDWLVRKSCNRCGRYLPINAASELTPLSFSLHCKKRAPCRHGKFRDYEIQNPDNCHSHPFRQEGNRIVSHHGHQLECRTCKKFFVNAPLNPQRDSQQHREDSLRRRAFEVLTNSLQDLNSVHMEFKRQKKEFSTYIWEKFNKRCFNCGKRISVKEMALDHTMPLAYLYRMDETATCLCSSCNSKKSDSFPVDFYTQEKLSELSAITGLSLEKLNSRSINRSVLKILVENVVWFFDDFLMDPHYQKVRGHILTADKIHDALKRVIANEVDLVAEYIKIKGKKPTSISC